MRVPRSATLRNRIMKRSIKHDLTEENDAHLPQGPLEGPVRRRWREILFIQPVLREIRGMDGRKQRDNAFRYRQRADHRGWLCRQDVRAGRPADRRCGHDRRVRRSIPVFTVHLCGRDTLHRRAALD